MDAVGRDQDVGQNLLDCNPNDLAYIEGCRRVRTQIRDQ
jgi:hypothetical protein